MVDVICPAIFPFTASCPKKYPAIVITTTKRPGKAKMA
jgi:hypothetical protein